MDPSLASLRSFVAVVDAGSMSRAAELLHVTTPALSQQILRLERQLGVALFERRPSGVVATPEGAHVADLARRALDAYGEVLGWRDRRGGHATVHGAVVVAHVGSAARQVGAVGTETVAALAAPRAVSWLARELGAALDELDRDDIAALLVRACDLDEDARERCAGLTTRAIGEPDAVVVVVGDRSRFAGDTFVAAHDLTSLVFAANAAPGADLLSLHTMAPSACPTPERRRPVATLDEAMSLASSAPIAALTVASAATAAFVPGTHVLEVTGIAPVPTLLLSVDDMAGSDAPSSEGDSGWPGGVGGFL